MPRSTCKVSDVVLKPKNVHLKNKETTRCHLLFYCASYTLNMFRALLCPPSGARDYNVGYHVGRFVLLCCRLEVRCGLVGVVSGLQAKPRALAYSPNNTPT